MTYTVTITSQGQITIPADVRRLLKLDKQMKALIEVKENTMVLTPEPDVLSLCGIFKSKKKSSWKQEKKFIEDGWSKSKI